MELQSFLISRVLKEGWIKFKEHPVTWIAALLLYFLILATHPFVNNWLMGKGFTVNIDESIQLPSSVDQIKQQMNSLNHLLSFAYFIIQLGLSLGLINMGLRAADNRNINIFHLFSRFHYVFHYLIAYILYVLIVIGGLILFIIPGAIAASKFALYPYFIVDRGAGPIEALKLSSKATDGSKWDIFAFIIISCLLSFAGGLVFFVGLLLVIPVIRIAWARIYRKLSSGQPV